MDTLEQTMLFLFCEATDVLGKAPVQINPNLKLNKSEQSRNRNFKRGMSEGSDNLFPM